MAAAVSHRHRGIASERWGLYTGGLRVRRTGHSIRFSSLLRERGSIDPMRDYIEGADWWLCRSERSRAMLQKMFDQQEVAICLYERVGAILDLGREASQYLLAVQLVRQTRDDEWMLDISLSDVGVYLEETWLDV